MTRLAVVTKDAPPPAGSYSQAMRSGAMVYISGQTPRNIDGQRLTGASFAEQATRALDNPDAVARAAGLSLRDAIKVNVYLRRPEDAAAFDALYRPYVAEPHPARSLTISPFTAFDVEIDAILLDPKV
ncbi:MAG: RidA family protein [Candidatus Saccharibacteria bacterium]|nr:RidA family protein [Pseudorhodobacter sp.]